MNYCIIKPCSLIGKTKLKLDKQIFKYIDYNDRLFALYFNKYTRYDEYIYEYKNICYIIKDEKELDRFLNLGYIIKD